MKHTLRSRNVRLRAAEDGTPGRLIGVGTVFDAPYRIAPQRTETISPEAFATSLRNSSVVPIFWGHGWAKNNETPIGVARLRNGEHGVEIENAQLNMANAKAQDVWHAIEGLDGEAALREWSLGFVASQVRQREIDGMPDDFIERGDILEISVVLRGAAPTFMGAEGAYAMREDDYLALRDAEISAGTAYINDSSASSGADIDQESTDSASSANDASSETPDVEETSENTEVEQQQLKLLQQPGFRAAVRAQLQTDTA